MWRQTRWRLPLATAFRCRGATRWSSPGMHLIPRYSGDVADPRGGVRHLMLGKGNYLAGPLGSASGQSYTAGVMGVLTSARWRSGWASQGG